MNEKNTGDVPMCQSPLSQILDRFGAEKEREIEDGRLLDASIVSVNSAGQAIELIAKFYTPGLIEFYAELSPDPWQEALNELERFGFSENPQQRRDAIQKFLKCVMTLMERYRRHLKTALT
jgi:hypothetical protein